MLNPGASNMKLRIALWATAGALIDVLWGLYIAAAVPSAHSPVWTLAYLTCPISLARQHPLSFYSVLFINAATYALFGAAVEALRSFATPTS